MGSMIDESQFNKSEFNKVDYMIDNSQNFIRMVCRVCGAMLINSVFHVDCDCPECFSEEVMQIIREHENT